MGPARPESREAREKPGVSNAIEAEKLFRHDLLDQPGAPVLLEAAHSWFHPAWSKFTSLLEPADIATARSYFPVPVGVIGQHDIRLKYDLAGGAMMDLGPYCMGSIRLALGSTGSGISVSVPESCEKIEYRGPNSEPDRPDVDQSFQAHFRFPSGGLGIAKGNLVNPLSCFALPKVEVVHRPVVVDEEELHKQGIKGKISGEQQQQQQQQQQQVVERVRTVSLNMFLMPTAYHNIHVSDEYILRSSTGDQVQGEVLRRWTVTKDHKAYSFREIGLADQPGEPYWTTYRYCLEQFVNRIRGRETPQWFGAEDLIAMARMIDMAYQAAGMNLRPTSAYE